MNKFLQDIKKGATIWLGFVIVIWISHAWTGLQADDGDILTAAKWNDLLARVDSNTNKINNISFSGGLTTHTSIADITNTEDRTLSLTPQQAPIGSIVYLSLKIHSGGHAKNHYVELYSNNVRVANMGIHSSGYKTDGNNISLPITTAADRNLRLNYVNQSGTSNTDGAQLHYQWFTQIVIQ